MNKQEILRLASEYEAFKALIIRAAANVDASLGVYSILKMEYLEDGIRATLHRPGFRSRNETVLLTYEELERA